MIDAYRDGLGARAAARLSDDDVFHAARDAAARVEEEIARMQRDGGFKAVNRSYRDYRLAAAGNGERALPYAAWLLRYKAGLVREIAAHLR